MKQAYPIIITKDGNMLSVFVPDFEINTEGIDYAEAMEMARDAIGIAGIVMQDEQISVPVPSLLKDIRTDDPDSIITLVDVDFNEYRRLSDTKTVRRNVSLQSWLDYAAAKAGINVSAVCQKALMAELNMYEPKYYL